MSQDLSITDETQETVRRPSDGNWGAVAEVGPMGQRSLSILCPEGSSTTSHVLKPVADYSNGKVLLVSEKPFIVRQDFLRSGKPCWNALVAQPISFGQVQKVPRLSPTLPTLSSGHRRWTLLATLAERVKLEPEKLWESFHNYRNHSVTRGIALDMAFAPGHGTSDSIAWIGKTTSAHLEYLEFWFILGGELQLHRLFVPRVASAQTHTLERLYVPTAWAENICRFVEGVAALGAGAGEIVN